MLSYPDVAVRAHDEHRCPLDLTPQEVEKRKGRVVRPVQVLEYDHEWGAGRNAENQTRDQVEETEPRLLGLMPRVPLDGVGVAKFRQEHRNLRLGSHEIGLPVV